MKTREAVAASLGREHLVAALVVWVAAGAGLVWAAPLAAVGALSHPVVVAVTHLFTLGWITIALMGAVHRLLPGALGSTAGGPRLGRAALWLHLAGLLGFETGLLAREGPLLLTGAAALGTGLALFAVGLASGLVRARRGGPARWALAGAALFLVATVVLGILLAVNLRAGIIENRFLVVGLHLHIGTGGWVLLALVGLGDGLLPGLLGTGGVSRLPGRVAAVLLGGGAGLLSLVHHGVPARWAPAGGAFVGAGATAFLVQALLHVRAAGGEDPDGGTEGRSPRPSRPWSWVAGAGLLLLGAAVALAAPATARGLSSPALAGAYAAALLPGALALVLAGGWGLALREGAGSDRSETGLPEGGGVGTAGPGERRRASGGALLLVLGALGLVPALAVGSELLSRLAGGAYAVGAAVVAWRLGPWRRRPSGTHDVHGDPPADRRV